MSEPTTGQQTTNQQIPEKQRPNQQSPVQQRADQQMAGRQNTPGAGRAKRSHSRSTLRNTLEWVGVIVAAVVVALLIKTFVVQAFRIPSASMMPTLQEHDRVLVNKLSYDAHDLNRGDVVVFTRPESLAAGPDDPKDLIKRVIGLPGEKVSTRDGQVYIDGQLLNEPYLAPGTMTYGIEEPLEVPDDKVLVLGDNRGDSTDGRVFGPIAPETIVGRAFMIMWPLSRIGPI